MSSDSDPYPIDCPFCSIASSFPYESSKPINKASRAEILRSSVPSKPDAAKIEPNCFLVLSAPDVLAFLDIMPMTPGHLLVTSRNHHVKIGDVPADEASKIGFWLPMLSRTVMKVTDTTDYNLVQNNGVRAAQVVPHVHFHIIPRPESVPQIVNKSWTMFGRGRRDDLDEEDAEKLAAALRAQLKVEIEESLGIKSLI